MVNFKRFNPALLKPQPIPEPRELPPGKMTDEILTQQIRQNEAAQAVIDHVVDGAEINTVPVIIDHESDDVEMHDENKKLERLIDEDFPFDPSQLAAVEGLIQSTHGCLTGAAGTGKTTVTKKLVDELLNTTTLTQLVDMTNYFKKDVQPADDDDEYEVTQKHVPSICLCTFTGKASQQIKKNFPRRWHTNIMTIHRMLAYAPVWYEVMDENDELVSKMRFEPTYDASNKMPWDIIIMDEAGMNSVDLWLQVLAAMKPGCRVYMVGDINQLPPVHGRSIFGFALSHWPSYELTEIHRQVGVNNSIVDNAWRILQGRTPQDDSPPDSNFNLIDQKATVDALNWMVSNSDWKSLLLEIPAEPRLASKRIRQVLKLLQDKFYDPIRDVVITAINGHDSSTAGAVLGQIPMNRELSVSLNQNPDRYVVDAGREVKNFAVGDKVMATKNDHEVGVTNGMTGIVLGIEEHPGWSGDFGRFGLIHEVQAYIENLPEDTVEFSLDDIADSYDAQEAGALAKKEAKDRGPASHVITVKFGEGDSAFEIAFSTLAEVQSLAMAYVVTGHKMQGGEAPHVFTICHHSHKIMLFREWLYTDWTRASERAILLYTPGGLRYALNKQRIKGKTLAEKIQSFLGLTKEYGRDADRVGRLPDSVNLATGEKWSYGDLPQNTGSFGVPVLRNVGSELDDSALPTETGGTAPAFKFGVKPTPRVVEVVVERVTIREVVVESKVHAAEAEVPASKDEPVDAEYTVVDSLPAPTYDINGDEPFGWWLESNRHDDGPLSDYDWGVTHKLDPHIRWPEPTGGRGPDRVTPPLPLPETPPPVPTPVNANTSRLLAFIKAKEVVTAPAPKFMFGVKK